RVTRRHLARVQRLDHLVERRQHTHQRPRRHTHPQLLQQSLRRLVLQFVRPVRGPTRTHTDTLRRGCDNVLTRGNTPPRLRSQALPTGMARRLALPTRWTMATPVSMSEVGSRRTTTPAGRPSHLGEAL